MNRYLDFENDIESIDKLITELDKNKITLNLKIPNC